MLGFVCVCVCVSSVVFTVSHFMPRSPFFSGSIFLLQMASIPVSLPASKFFPLFLFLPYLSPATTTDTFNPFRKRYRDQSQSGAKEMFNLGWLVDWKKEKKQTVCACSKFKSTPASTAAHNQQAVSYFVSPRHRHNWKYMKLSWDCSSVNIQTASSPWGCQVWTNLQVGLLFLPSFLIHRLSEQMS